MGASDLVSFASNIQNCRENGKVGEWSPGQGKSGSQRDSEDYSEIQETLPITKVDLTEPRTEIYL